MKARRLVMVLAVTLIAGGSGASRGLAHMQETYNGVCGQLSGFPGLLQRMHLFAQGNCAIKAGTTTKCDKVNAPCKISNPPSGSSGNGFCKQQSATCVCTLN